MTAVPRTIVNACFIMQFIYSVILFAWNGLGLMRQLIFRLNEHSIQLSACLQVLVIY